MTKRIIIRQPQMKCHLCGTAMLVEHDEYEGEYQIVCPKCGDASESCSTAAEAREQYRGKK